MLKHLQLAIFFTTFSIEFFAGEIISFAPANLTPFGEVIWREVKDPGAKKILSEKSFPLRLAEGQALQVEWKQPRDVRAVQLDFAGAAPNPEEIIIEWWHRIWPDNGSGGWMKLDDPFNGEWTRVKAKARPVISAEGRGQAVPVPGAEKQRQAVAAPITNRLEFEFAPLDQTEVPGVKRAGLAYRQTYKIRVSLRQGSASARPGGRPLPVLQQVRVFSDAVEKRARIRFEWDVQTKVPGRWYWSPRFEARNGRIIETRKAGKKAVTVEVVYADATNRLSADRGMIICRSGDYRSFSVFIDDVLREGGLYVRDIGAFVSDADKNLTYATWPGAKGEVWKEGTIMEQVGRMPEQNFEQVMKAIPPKAPNEIFLGVPYLRQEIAVGPQGDVRLYADSLRSAGPDADRRPWKWKSLVYRFSTGEDPPAPGRKDSRAVTRTLAEGWLPVARHEWKEGEIGWTETCLAAPLLEPISTFYGNPSPQPSPHQMGRGSRTGTEPIVLVTQLAMTNTSAEPRTASLWLEMNPYHPLRLVPDGTLFLQFPSDATNHAPFAPVRGFLKNGGRGRWEIISLAAAGRGQAGATNGQTRPAESPRQVVHYVLVLPPNQAHAVEVAVPYIELMDDREVAALKTVAYEPVRNAVVEFWKARVNQGMTYEVPERFLNEFFKANLWHVLISTDIDPETGHYQHGAATHVYPNFANETAMVARSLEMRGEHAEAARLLQPFLDCQGVKGLPGNFKSKQGVFYAAHPTEPDPYTAQGYNMHHGWVLWAAAEHLAWTGDEAWFRGVADKLVKGCDWISREREATKFKNGDGSRPVEYGLAPAGDLEDVAEYLYWYATDAYYHLGMKQTAAALKGIGHAQTRRVRRETADFSEDIQASVAESVATSPVVRLRDGSYIPYVPSRAYGLTHLKEGWIREALYPALYLFDGEVYPENHPYVDWMLQDLEDNIFLSKESGYGVADPKANFFNLGGFTMQPNLPNLPLIYLQRDQVPNFLRGFYNTCWASLYPDAMCFAEWVPDFGRGGGPLFKTPDECKFIQWMRYMLVMERGRELELGLGVPRAWMEDGKRVKIQRAATLFGLLDLEIKSSVSSGRIDAKVKLSKTEAPKGIWLRLRHPDGRALQSALVNGKKGKLNRARQLIELPAGSPEWEVRGGF